MTKTVLLTGATGMVGGHVLDLLLDHPSVKRVISIARRPVGSVHVKLDETEHRDLGNFAGLETKLTGVDVCFHCLGVYQGQVDSDTFFKITCDYQKALTDCLQQTSPDATFVLFGAQGADPGETSRATFARAKGRAENLLNQTAFSKKYIFRPGYIHPTGSKRPSGVMYRMLAHIGGPLLRLFPSAGITDRELAGAMVSAGIASELPSGVFENAEIKALVSRAVRLD